MIILGAILLIIGLIVHSSILWIIGIIVLVIGAVLALAGSLGKGVGGDATITEFARWAGGSVAIATEPFGIERVATTIDRPHRRRMAHCAGRLVTSAGVAVSAEAGAARNSGALPGAHCAPVGGAEVGGPAAGVGDSEIDLDAALTAARTGDEVAFGQVYRLVHPRLLRYLRVLVGNDADDIAAAVASRPSTALSMTASA